MATLTQAEQKWYRDNLNNQAQQAAAHANSIVRAADQEDIAGLRDLAIETTNLMQDIYGSNAKVLSNELFDNVMQKEGSTKRAEFIDDLLDDSYTDDFIRYLMQFIVDGQPDIFYEKYSEFNDYLTRRQGILNMIKNSERNRVKYARIPAGLNPCAFCIMLASRGFVYHTAQSAGETSEYHPHCHCIVVPSNDGSLDVDGYSDMVEEYYRAYRAGYEGMVDELGDDLLSTGYKDRRSLMLSIMRQKYSLK